MQSTTIIFILLLPVSYIVISLTRLVLYKLKVLFLISKFDKERHTYKFREDDHFHDAYLKIVKRVWTVNSFNLFEKLFLPIFYLSWFFAQISVVAAGIMILFYN